MRLDSALIKSIFLSMRPSQWIKNTLLLAPLVFSLRLTDTAHIIKSMQGFFIFTILVSGVYLLNDFFDLSEDRQHPIRRRRPMASGALRPDLGLGTGLLFILTAVVLAFWLSRSFALASLIYLFMQAAYTLWLKRVLVIDLLIISLGFVLRALAGALLLNVALSNWLIACTFFLALFLIIGKRIKEPRHYRSRPLHYSLYLFFFLTLCAYTMYVLEMMNFYGPLLLLSTFFVLLGLMRYVRLVFQDSTQSPTDIIINDRILLPVLGSWLVLVVMALYN